MTRRAPAFEAEPDTTVTSPPLTVLACGCRVDQDGCVWYPCPAIYGTYGCARYLASTGRRSEMLARCEARIEAHIAQVTAAANRAALGEQAVLL